MRLQMKINPIFLSLFFVLFIVSSCKNDDDGTPAPAPKKFTIEVEEIYTSPPSKVSVFFRVKDQNDMPVSGLTQDDFSILEKGRNDTAFKLISADEADRILSDNEQIFDYKVMLLLDLSASVVNNDLDKLKAAAREFVADVMNTNINSSTKVGIWWFDGADVLHPLMDFTNNGVALQEAINGIEPSITTDNSTDLYGAIIKGTQLIKAEMSSSAIQGFLSASSVILFTDGTDQAARYTKEEAFTAINDAPTNVNYYSIGLGAEIDETVLNTIGSTSAVFADDAASLTEKFEEIAQLIYDETNSFYLYEYCTPKRDGSGENEIQLEVEKENQSGSVMSSFDATGFTSGCELF